MTVNVYELYVDLVTVAQPVVVVTPVSPDPYTASTIVPIAWVNTIDADGGQPLRREVKVFTDAQYGAGGFDPYTSTPYLTTGEVPTSRTDVDVGPLANGDTYRVYVRVAQTVNGVSHWSDWAFDEFTMDVVTSDVDTVTAVASDSEAKITVTVERDAASEAWEQIEVERSIDAGATWSQVRTATLVDATGDADTYVVDDYETANGESAIYRARATHAAAGSPITGNWVMSSSASWSSSLVWLKSPLDPSKNITVDIGTPFVMQSLDVRTGVYPVIGRAAPVVLSDTLSLPASSLQIETRTDGEYTALVDLLRQSVLLYHPTDCEGGTTARYIAVTGVSEMPTVIRNMVVRVWTVSYVEIDVPADPLAGSV